MYVLISGEKYKLIKLSDTMIDIKQDFSKIDFTSVEMKATLCEKPFTGDINMITFPEVNVNFKEGYYLIDGVVYIVEPEGE